MFKSFLIGLVAILTSFSQAHFESKFSVVCHQNQPWEEFMAQNQLLSLGDCSPLTVLEELKDDGWLAYQVMTQCRYRIRLDFGGLEKGDAVFYTTEIGRWKPLRQTTIEKVDGEMTTMKLAYEFGAGVTQHEFVINGMGNGLMEKTATLKARLGSDQKEKTHEFTCYTEKHIEDIKGPQPVIIK